MSKLKIKTPIEVEGTTINVDVAANIFDTYGTGNYAYATVAGTASVLRQVLKSLKKEGTIGYDKLWVRSESYAGGDSIRVHTHNGVNTKLIESIVNRFQGGSFDGMTDMYNYNAGGFKITNPVSGDTIDLSTKHSFYYDSAPYGATV